LLGDLWTIKVSWQILSQIPSIIFLIIIWFFLILPFSTSISTLYFGIKNHKIEYSKTIYEIKKQNSIWTWNFEYKLNHPIKNKKDRYIRSYDYGWKKYEATTLEWLKFSILDNKDKELFFKFTKNQNLINSFSKTSELNNILTSNKTKIITSNDDLIIKYK